uniref:ZP domain-containing protein n=3 Tax=Bursaphelenchus xylophilus TaxID=6326 RepID=A0A1I7S1B8_BURXY
MDLGKVAIIIRALQACNTLFGDVKPNNFEVTSFKVTDGTIEKFVTMDNATGFETSPIKYDGPAFQGIRLQMSIQGDKTIVGGQVTKVSSDPEPQECPVIGDDKELNVVADCTQRTCPYLFGNAVYVIHNKHSYLSLIYKKLDVIEAKHEQPNIDCSERFGVDDVEGTFIFKKNGTCTEVNVDEFELPWEPHECDTAPIILTPDTPTQYYHLRYLTILASCEMPSTITEEMVDNTFIRFTHIDSTETTTALPVSETSDVAVQSQLELAALVLGSLAVAVFLGLIIVGIVVCVKCREICMCCGKKTEKKEKKKKLSQGKPPSVTAPLPHSAQENTKSLKKEEKDEDGEVFLEYMEDESDE